MKRLWIVEIYRGTAWVPIVYCHSVKQAEQAADRITGERVRVREYGTAAIEAAAER